MSKIKSIKARQILDSRGNPTIEVDMMLSCGSFGRGVVPSGASTGSLEALELRDHDNSVYQGQSVYKAVDNVNKEISKLVVNNQDFKQDSFDKLLIDLDGTENKSRLGANTILALSLAFAHANAKSKNLPLYKTFNNNSDYILPVQ